MLALKVPVVSVVMTVYNSARTLSAAVDSVLAQSFQDLELIVCDDASMDATATILAAVADPRVRVIRNLINLGPGPSRDEAIKIARGQWLAVIDADDVWRPKRLERLLQAVHDDCDQMVFDDLVLCHDGPSGLIPWKRLRGARAFGGDGSGPIAVTAERFVMAERLLIKPLVPMSRVRRSGAKHGSRRFSEDTFFFLTLICDGLAIAYVPEALYLYRLTSGSLTSIPDRDRQMVSTLKEIQSTVPLPSELSSAFDNKICHVERIITYRHVLSSFRGRAWRQLLPQLFANPWVVKAFLVRGIQDIGRVTHKSLSAVAERFCH